MIHSLVESHVKKTDSGFLSDWSRNNTYESTCSDWLSYFNETSGPLVVSKKQNGGGEAYVCSAKMSFLQR